MSLSQKPKMLAPYRVLDLTDEKGFYCGQLLGSLGADVIKIESPGGDASRKVGPFYKDRAEADKSLYWFAYNSNKRGITLDLKSGRGKALFFDLVKKADVIIESFQPGYLTSIGIGYDVISKVNPGVVMTSIAPFGQSGPHSNWKGSDLVCWAMGGLLSQTGDPDRPPVRISHVNFAYLISSMDAAWGTMMALFWRAKSGKGQHVDASIQESVIKSTFITHETWEVMGKERPRGSSMYKVPNSPVMLNTVWATKDGGYLYLMVRGGELGARENPIIVQWMAEEGMADDFIKSVNWSELDWLKKSQAEAERIQGYFERFFKSKTKDEIIEGAFKRKVVLQPICSPRDIFKHPQLAARSYWQEVTHPELGTNISYPGRFVDPSATACGTWRRAPLPGEHNEEVYSWLGVNKNEFASLKQAGVI
jgi:crotonobetainyl-CoA:carnitine CoA-transferase CaiB-like acyl-CoA transferase